jgi:hypothetical protein
MSIATSPGEARTVSVLRSSGLVRALDWMLGTVAASWGDSLAGRAWRSGGAWAKAQPTARRARMAGAFTAVASATALAFQRLAPRLEPGSSVVPTAFLMLGLCVLVTFRERPAR